MENTYCIEYKYYILSNGVPYEILALEWFTCRIVYRLFCNVGVNPQKCPIY